jgi:hypothetical protein
MARRGGWDWDRRIAGRGSRPIPITATSVNGTVYEDVVWVFIKDTFIGEIQYTGGIENSAI